jgi:hypothetical protein
MRGAILPAWRSAPHSRWLLFRESPPTGGHERRLGRSTTNARYRRASYAQPSTMVLNRGLVAASSIESPTHELDTPARQERINRPRWRASAEANGTLVGVVEMNVLPIKNLVQYCNCAATHVRFGAAELLRFDHFTRHSSSTV